MAKGKIAKGIAIKLIEMRRCIVCRQVFKKFSLIRIVKNPDGKIFLDETGKASGRGSYICKSVNCIESLKKHRKFDRIFKQKLPDEFYEEIKEKLHVN